MVSHNNKLGSQGLYSVSMISIANKLLKKFGNLERLALEIRLCKHNESLCLLHLLLENRTRTFVHRNTHFGRLTKATPIKTSHKNESKIKR